MPYSEVERQTRCIDRLLADAKVTHVDQDKGGKNLAVRCEDDGGRGGGGSKCVLSLIDFDMAVLDGDLTPFHPRSRVVWRFKRETSAVNNTKLIYNTVCKRRRKKKKG